MTGLEKTKAKAGEVSVSARALSLSDMHNLYDLCFRPNASPAEMRWGIVRYVSPPFHINFLVLTVSDFILICLAITSTI
jgi:hypothetical protein